MTTTPLVLLTGVNADAMAHAMIGLQWDAPNAVNVRHSIDVDRQILTRVVSDQGGIVEQLSFDLEHACVSCALREDIMPTLERLADDGRWGSIIAHLPVAAGADQICRILDHDEVIAAKLHIASVLAVVNGPTARADLLGDDLLRERHLETSPEDSRGVAEVHAALIEYADSIVVVGEIDETDRHLVSMLLRPDAGEVLDHLQLDTASIVGARRHHDDAEAWVDPGHTQPVGLVRTGKAWTVELRSDRPFHPERLMANLEHLGGGARRSRGCFWLPTRHDSVCEWDGAGGQLSVGVCEHGTSEPHTRILVTGIDDDRDELVALFHRCLLTDDEIAVRGTIWESDEDGYEPWLGPIRQNA
ncbi:GTP-binding protein [Aeromicrobium sp. P5_D10]